jgi:pyruvate,water dikinase
LQETSSDETFAALKRHGPEGFVDKVDQYIRDFGYRSNNELKLEEPDMRQSPAVLFDMLKAAIQVQAGVAPAPAAESADAWISKLGFFRRAVFNLVRSKVKSAIRARETVRFCRSRAFGIARRLFRAIGDKLAQAGVLQTGADVFFLQLEEVRGCFEGTTSGREIKPLVQQRRADDAHYRQLPALPARFVTRGPVAGFDFSSLSERSSAQGELRGAACCPGIVEGLAKVVSEPNQFDGGILVTYRTDPGWVPVFASAKALLIERGSPLTHAAIVAREMGIPTIVQIPGLLSQVQSGMHLKVNGNSGQVTILEAPSQKAG